MATTRVRFTLSFNSTDHGDIAKGDELDLDEASATRYVKAGWAEPVKAKPAAKPRGRAAGRNGKEG